jgi:leucyl/phenylalanyl-tRNA--protein transferase
MTAVPLDPDPSPWVFPDLRESATGGTGHDEVDDLVAMGADLAPGTVLAAYRAGIFPMPGEGVDGMLWWSPVTRGVLPVHGLRVSRSLRQSVRRMQIRVDTAFREVVDACADPDRDGAWIDGEITEDGQLVGGLYGVAIGGLFAGESMFHRVRDASKVALVGLVSLLDDEHADRRLVDVQWQTPHLESLGVVEVPRTTYLRQLEQALKLPLPEQFG